MKDLKNILKEVFEKKERVLDTLSVFQKTLEDEKNGIPPFIAIGAKQKNITVSRYTKGTLTLTISSIYNAPELHFALHRLKEVLTEKIPKKQIKTIRIIQTNQNTRS